MALGVTANVIGQLAFRRQREWGSCCPRPPDAAVGTGGRGRGAALADPLQVAQIRDPSTNRVTPTNPQSSHFRPTYTCAVGGDTADISSRRCWTSSRSMNVPASDR